jgi:hypothetical protein
MTPVPSSALAALHALTTPPVGSMGRSLAPVPEEAYDTVPKASKSKTIVTKNVSYTEAFANGIASTAQAHADMERKIVELQGQLVKRKWSWPLAYVLKLPLSVLQALISTIRALQSSSSWSTDKALLWGIAIFLAIDKLGVQLAPQVKAVLSVMARATVRLLSLMMRQGVALSRRMISALLARVLTGFAGILSGAAVLAQAPVVPRPDTRPIDASEVIAAIHTQMLSPLVNTVVPVHNLDGSIDESSPGREHFYWVEGPSDRSYWGDEPGNVHY